MSATGTFPLNHAQAAAQAETERLASAEGAEIFGVLTNPTEDGAVRVDMRYFLVERETTGLQSIIYAADGTVIDMADWGAC